MINKSVIILMLTSLIILTSVQVFAAPNFKVEDVWIHEQPIGGTIFIGNPSLGSKGFTDLTTNSISVVQAGKYSTTKLMVAVKITNIGDTGSGRIEATFQRRDLVNNWFKNMQQPFAVFTGEKINNCVPSERFTATKSLNIESGKTVYVFLPNIEMILPSNFKDLSGTSVVNSGEFSNDKDYGIFVETFVRCSSYGNSPGVMDYKGVPLTIKFSDSWVGTSNTVSGGCANGIIDGSESDIDCGGFCARDESKSCGLGERCNSDTDCTFGTKLGNPIECRDERCYQLTDADVAKAIEDAKKIVPPNKGVYETNEKCGNSGQPNCPNNSNIPEDLKQWAVPLILLGGVVLILGMNSSGG